MDLTERINLLPDTLRRQILQAVCGNSSSPRAATPPDARPVIRNNSSGHAEGVRSKPSPLMPLLPASDGDVPEIQLTAGACIVDDFIPQEHVKEALVCARQALSEGAQQAAIGGALPLVSAGRQVDTAARGDIMRWLHPSEEVSSGRGALAALLERMEALRSRMERQGFYVGGRPTFQLASYPGGGTRYVRHCDASLSCPTRTLTAIVYLNESDWEPQVDGGCLALYNVPYTGPLRGCGLAAGEPATVVAPVGGRLVVFESHLFHEVLPAYRNRYAVTAWFHQLPPTAKTTTEEQQPSAALPQQPPPLAPAPNQRPAASELCIVGRLGNDVCDISSGGDGSGGEGAVAVADDHYDAAIAPAMVAEAAAVTTDAATAAADSEASAAKDGRVEAMTVRGAGAAAVRSAAATEGPPAAAAAATVATAATAVTAVTAAARIFVSVAAYRDPEGPWTLHSLFNGADLPERVRVGVVWQIDPISESSFAAVAGSRTHPGWLSQVRQVVLPYQDAAGPCKARALAQSLWSGEEFVLQLDSHMRMVRGWDTKCIQQLEAAEKLSATGKAVLSTYPLGYSGAGAAASVPDEVSAPATLLCASGFGPDGFLRTVGRVLRERPAAPIPSYFWAAGLSFARSRWLQEVPYCPYLLHLFFGEESYMLARMWTRGWDVFAPAVPLAFHQWERSARLHTYQRDLMGQGPASNNQLQSQGTEAQERQEQEEGKGRQEEQMQAGGAVLGLLKNDWESDNGGGRGAEVSVLGDVTAATTAASAAASAAAAAARQRSQARVLCVLRSGGNASSQRDPPTAATAAAVRDVLVGEAVSAPHGVWLGACDAALAVASSGRRGVGGGGADGDCGDGWTVGQVWGLGTVRSLGELAEACGVDYAAGIVSARARWVGLSEGAFDA